MSKSNISSAQALLSQTSAQKEIDDTLFHYTNEAGLYGILESQSLWATHFRFLNDRKEFWHYIEEQERAIAWKDLKEKLFNAQETSAINFLEFKDLCKRWIAQVPPFIFSFCGIDDLNDNQKYKNGDLVMWSSYGQKGGYAIGFSKIGLKKLTDYEYNHFDYLMPPEGPTRVRYEMKQEEKDELFNALSKAASDRQFEHKPLIEALRKGCSHKHPAFKAECEHRIFCWTDIKQAKKSQKLEKKVGFRSIDQIPYIALNEKIENNGWAKLPLKTIIVGPCRDQDDRVAKLEIWLKSHGIDISVQPSNIPFVG